MSFPSEISYTYKAGVKSTSGLSSSQALGFNFHLSLPPSPSSISSSFLSFLPFKIIYKFQFNPILSGPNILTKKRKGRLWKAQAL